VRLQDGVHVREAEAADAEIRVLGGGQLGDRRRPPGGLLEGAEWRHHAEHLVHLGRAIAEVHVVGVLHHHHALALRRRAREQLAHAVERQQRVAIGDDEERRHLAAPREVEAGAQRPPGHPRRPARRRERQRATERGIGESEGTDARRRRTPGKRDRSSCGGSQTGRGRPGQGA
jgi:hypothetical protein